MNRSGSVIVSTSLLTYLLAIRAGIKQFIEVHGRRSASLPEHEYLCKAEQVTVTYDKLEPRDSINGHGYPSRRSFGP